jgi:hypothetical protein
LGTSWAKKDGLSAASGWASFLLLLLLFFSSDLLLFFLLKLLGIRGKKEGFKRLQNRFEIGFQKLDLLSHNNFQRFPNIFGLVLIQNKRRRGGFVS